MYRKKILPVACIFGLTAFIYLPSLFNGYIWDDDYYVFDSKWSKSEKPLGAIWFSRSDTPQYYPLVFTIFWAGHKLWGFEPFGFHLINLILHIANAMLVLAVTRKLVPRAAFAVALIFAVHPIQVETVAWIAELKNLLSLFFFLLACLYFFAYDEGEKTRDYVLSFVFFLGALLSKSIAVCFVIVPVLYRWWRHGSIRRKDIIIAIPFAIIGAVSAVNTIWLELYHVNTQGVEFVIPIADRFILFGRTTLFYLYKSLIPGDFIFFYPRWDIDPTHIGQWWYSFAVIALIIVSAIARNRIGRGAVSLFVFYCVSIFPASGIFDVFPMIYSYVADHFSYLSTPAIFLMLVSGGIMAGERLKARYQWASGKAARYMFVAIAIICLMLLGARTFTLQANYQDSITLWQRVIAKNPGCSAAYNNLAGKIGAAEPEKAIALLKKAIALDPQFINALYNIGTLYIKRGEPVAAIPYFKKALLIDASRSNIHNNLGVAYLDLRQYDDSIDSFARAIRLDPARQMSVLNIVDAINLKRADQIQDPSGTGKADSETCNQVGLLLGRQGDYKSAIILFEEAIGRDPDNSSAYNNLGYTYYLMGDYEKALNYFQEAVSVYPGYKTARQNLERLQALMAGRPGVLSR